MSKTISLSVDSEVYSQMQEMYPEKVGYITEKLWRMLLEEEGNIKGAKGKVKIFVHDNANMNARIKLNECGWLADFRLVQQIYAAHGVQLLANEYYELRIANKVGERTRQVLTLKGPAISGEWMERAPIEKKGPDRSIFNDEVQTVEVQDEPTTSN